MELRLTLPAHSSVRDPRAILSVKELQEWVGELPVANTELAAQTIKDAVSLFNRQPVPYAQRFELLEIYRNAACSIQEQLENRIQFNAGNNSITRPAWKLLSQLAREFSLGYKDVVKEASAEIGGKKAPPAIGPAIVRSLEYLVYTLRLELQNYQACPVAVRREINRLYEFAEYHQLLEAQVNDGQDGRVAITATDCFKTALLLLISNPNRLQLGEARGVHRLVLQLSRYAIISRPDGMTDFPGRFTFDLGDESPPSPYGEDHFDPASPTIRLLITEDLVDHVTQIVDEASEIPEFDSYELRVLSHPRRADRIDLLKRLTAAWLQKANRRHQREALSGWLLVTYGIAAAHYFANGETTRPGWFDKDRRTNDEDDKDNTIFMGGDDYSYSSYRCQLVDHSEGGIAIAVTSEIRELRIGQVVGFRTEGEEEGDEWFIGVIRWFSKVNDGTLHTGIQHMASVALPISVHGVRKRKATTDMQPAFILKDYGTLRGDAILVPHGIFEAGQEVAIIDHQNLRSGTVLDRVESTGSYDLFNCTIEHPES